MLSDWPVIGAVPPRIHLSDPRSARTTVTAWFVRHGTERRPRPLLRDVSGIVVTGVVRTTVDIASTTDLVVAVPIVDHVLRTSTASVTALLEATEALASATTKAREAISLGSALAESPAESLCRVRFHQLRTPTPVEQYVFARAGERPARVDFWFPAQGVVVEVDGRAKYGDVSDTADAHWREKRREDFIRSFPEVRTVVRLTWADLMDPERIRIALRRAGVPCR